VRRQLTGVAENRLQSAREDLHTINLEHNSRETIMKMFENGSKSVQHQILNYEF